MEEASTVVYQGRDIEREHFRVFVFSAKESRLVEDYEEYKKLIKSKKWFDEPIKEK